jgi:hypothetical protein
VDNYHEKSLGSMENISRFHPPPGSGSLPFRILHTKDYHGEEIKTKLAILAANLFNLLGLHFNSTVLLVFLRQDESLDSPCLASVGES